MKTFIGTTWQERQPFLDAEDHENEQLADIADRFALRRKRRNAHIAQLREQLRRLEERENRDWKIWNAAMDRHIARNKRICAMFDELKAAEESA